MKTINKIIPEVNSKYGAPMGRSNDGDQIEAVKAHKTIFDRKVPMCSCCGAYDEGGAYWGCTDYIHKVYPLRVAYTKDLSYVEFYRSSTSRKK